MPNRYLAGDSEREPFWQLPTWHFANNTQPSRRHQSRYSDHSLPWNETGPHRLCSMTPGQKKKTFTQRLLQPNALMGHASAVDPNAPSSPLVDPLPFTRPLKPSVYPQFSKKKNWSKRQWPNVSRRPVLKKKTSIKKKKSSSFSHCPKRRPALCTGASLSPACTQPCLQKHDRLPLLALAGS